MLEMLGGNVGWKMLAGNVGWKCWLKICWKNWLEMLGGNLAGNVG